MLKLIMTKCYRWIAFTENAVKKINSIDEIEPNNQVW